MESTESPLVTECPRKRKSNIQSRKRRQAQLQRYKRKRLPIIPVCKHSGSTYHCRKIKGRDALAFSDAFYKINTKSAQDTFILTYCKIEKPKRKDRNRRNGSRKGISVKYFIRMFSKELKQVCQKAFLNVLRISKSRVQRLCKAHFETGSVPVEKRGGDRKSIKYSERKANVIDHIKKYKTVEVHYCRSKVAKRQYLSSHLSINKMYRAYKIENPDIDVKSSYFRTVFNNNFNLGFKAPSSDVCSTCLRLKEQIKMEKDNDKKVQLITQSRVHKLRSKEFFNILNEKKDGLLTMSFDC